ncbi:MAG: hypothetical protein K0R65_713 [Crocinitomicaceae bacterium]|jgi:hypothetical protein|nr:hypothetical protein [Crocinitomicaceae bacterium]
MKKLFVFLFISGSCYSQNLIYRQNADQILREIHSGHFGYYFMNPDFEFEFAPNKKRKELHIKKATRTFIGKKGKKTVTEMEFNSKGYLLSSKNPANKYEFQARFQDDSLQVYSLSKRKKSSTEIKREFSKGNKIKEEKLKNGKRDYLLEIAYTNSGKISQSTVLRKNDRYKMLYEYNSDDKLKKNTYFKNDKLRKSWNYECKAEGALEASNKTELISSRCEYKEESSDGSYILYERTLNEGTPYLSEKKFTKDSVMYEWNNYVNDSILKRSWHKSGEWENEVTYRKGKIRYQTKFRSNSKGQILEYQHFSKNAMIFPYKNTYDSNGNCVLQERFKPKEQEPTYLKKRVFNANGTMQSEEVFNKGKLSYRQFYEYTF